MDDSVDDQGDGENAAQWHEHRHDAAERAEHALFSGHKLFAGKPGHDRLHAAPRSEFGTSDPSNRNSESSWIAVFMSSLLLRSIRSTA